MFKMTGLDLEQIEGLKKGFNSTFCYYLISNNNVSNGRFGSGPDGGAEEGLQFHLMKATYYQH
jgi:hypothetical protein